jgi:hypothetical protein
VRARRAAPHSVTSRLWLPHGAPRLKPATSHVSHDLGRLDDLLRLRALINASSAGPLSRHCMRGAAMQLHLAFLELTDPPPSPTSSTNPPPWGQIDEGARIAAIRSSQN